MPGGYTTVFRVSYLSNGELLESFVFLAAVLSVLIIGIRKLRILREAGVGPMSFWFIWCLGWVPMSLWMVTSTLQEGFRYTGALRQGRCAVVEGTVHVLFKQSATGHTAGDRILVLNQQFDVNYFVSTLAYSRTIEHGGALTEGRRVRLHYLGGAILKVEVPP